MADDLDEWDEGDLPDEPEEAPADDRVAQVDIEYVFAAGEPQPIHTPILIDGLAYCTECGFPWPCPEADFSWQEIKDFTRSGIGR